MEKSVSLEEIFQAIYRHEFSEPGHIAANAMLKCGEVSRKDQKFTEIGDRGSSKKDYHYVIPLPFRDSNVVFSNNKKQVIQRLMGLKRRFMKDNKFF